MLSAIAGAMVVALTGALAVSGEIHWVWTGAAFIVMHAVTAYVREHDGDLRCLARAEYIRRLGEFSIEELGIAANDPALSEATKRMIRNYLQTVDPDWHTRIRLAGYPDAIGGRRTQYQV